MIAGCSSGIEPLFSLCYRKHNILEGESLLYIDSNFERMAIEDEFYSDELMEYLANGGSIQDREDVPEWIKEVFVTSADISPQDHVRMQAAFQESVDAGISKTINFHNSATREDVRTAYLMAWELGCKGITVYRSGSREAEVLTSGATASAALEAAGMSTGAEPVTSVLPVPMARPAQVQGVTDRIRTGHGNMYVTINSMDGQPFEVFSNLGKSGGCDSAQIEAITRLVSLALRSGIDSSHVIDQLSGITCCPQWDNGVLVRSAPDAVALALSRHVAPADNRPLALAQGGAVAETPAPYAVQQELFLKTGANGNGLNGRTQCPECPDFLIHQEGCASCRTCGYEKCG